MTKKRTLNFSKAAHLLSGSALVFLLAAAPSGYAGNNENIHLTPIEQLGKYVFFDRISSPKRMGCVICHDPAPGGTGSVSGVNLHQVAITGANPHTVGSLKPPTNAYASLIEPFHKCDSGGLGAPPFFLDDVCGGNFWDGRSEGNESPVFAGAAPHIGEEIFYTSDRERLTGDR